MANLVMMALLHGIVMGMIYGAIAIGLSLIFGVLRVINFAHGSMLMASMFCYYLIFIATGISPYLSLFLIVPVFFFAGYLIQNVLIKPLFLRERSTVLEPVSALTLTTGIWFAMDNLALMLFGGNFRTMTTPLSGKLFSVGDFNLEITKAAAFIISILVIVFLSQFLSRTDLGRTIRSVSQNRDAAALCGVNVYRIYAITFGIGTASLALVGAFMTGFYFIAPSVGAAFGVKSFLIVVLGGLGSLPGALVGGLLFGIIESVGGQFMPATSANMLTFLVFIIVLFVRPKGIMGKF
ncbi:MAG TPA: branched-chain amino acid ABC transporter permease [Anaerovoracaceae bacterium]|nr:branched-chain amino acid ABC transporter permease [Anaerovoracaceae bacterium]